MILAIPDIHGEKLKLDSVLSQIDIPKLELLIFLGDMVDRGPDSIGVMKTVKKISEENENVVVLAGNHEWLMIDAEVMGTLEHIWLWSVNGGGYDVPEDLVKWAACLPLYHETKNFWFSHAPLPADEFKSLNRKSALECGYTKKELIWTYLDEDEKNYKEWPKGKIGVCGHIHGLQHTLPKPRPRFYKHWIFADAGCGCHPTAPLVAIDVEKRKIECSS